MPTGYASLRAAVKTKLDTLTGSGQLLSVVYDHFKPDVAGYPAAIFDISETENDFLTNADNMRVIAFRVYILQEISVKGLDAAATILDNAADAAVAAFEGDLSLGSACDWCEAIQGSRSTFESPQGLVMAQELTVRCHFTTLV